MFRSKTNNISEPLPEKTHYTKYYEHDGQLRAYANRSMLMAGLFGLIAFVSLLFAIYVRLQPPTVIRVAADGEATVVGGRPAGGSVTAGLLNVLAATQAGEVAPTILKAGPRCGSSSKATSATPQRRWIRISPMRST